MVRWLSERVGSQGQVVATDLDARWVADLSSAIVEVKVQDITVEPPSVGDLDLIHARMVLTHFRDPEAALAHMLLALRPGGWILLEEPDQGPPFGRCIPEEPAVGQFVQALRAMMEKGGGDPDFGRRLPVFLRGRGLTDLATHARYIPMTPELVISTADAAHDIVTSMGLMKSHELDAVRSFVQDPANLM
jgi:SAM-dependent methyltransferase